jgi:hypothetical protein
VSVNAHLKGHLKPTPGSQVLGTAGVPLSITRWTRHPHGESMDAKKIVSLKAKKSLKVNSFLLLCSTVQSTTHQTIDIGLCTALISRVS